MTKEVKIIAVLALSLLAILIYPSSPNADQVAEDSLGTIRSLPQWKATSSPQDAITTRVNNKNIYAPFASTTLESLIVTDLQGSGTKCVEVDNDGQLQVDGSACNTGGAGGAFSWTTTTNYGETVNATATPIWVQENIYASSTIYGPTFIAEDTTATSTFRGALFLQGTPRFDDLVSCDTIDTNADGYLVCGSDATGAGGGAFAWTQTSYGVSTSTTLGFLNGFLSTASSTINASSTITGVLTALGGVFGNVTGSLTGNADTATNLAANGANCAAGEIPLGVGVNGAVEGCYEPAEADITDLVHLATAITDGLIIEPDLNADNAPVDGDILVYDSTGTNFVWNTLAELGIQAQDDVLDDLSALGVIADNEFIVGTGAGTYANESGSTAVTSLENGAINVLLETEIDASSELLALMDDETGTGVLTFATAPTFTTSIDIGSAGVRFSDDGDGALTILGLGDGADENLVWNFDDTADSVVITTGTGVSTTTFSGINVEADQLYATDSAATSTIAGNLYLQGTPRFDNLVSCDTIDTNASGFLVCGNDATGAGGGAFAWTTETSFGETVNSTSTPIWFKDSIYASSTAIFSDSIQIPGGAGGTTVDVLGELTADSTSGTINFHDGTAERRLDPLLSKGFVINDPTNADFAGKDFPLWKATSAITITDIHCITDPTETGENQIIDIWEGNSTADSTTTVDALITCDSDGAEDDGSLSNGTIDANDWVGINFRGSTGAPAMLTGTIYYYIDP